MFCVHHLNYSTSASFREGHVYTDELWPPQRKVRLERLCKEWASSQRFQWYNLALSDEMYRWWWNEWKVVCGMDCKVCQDSTIDWTHPGTVLLRRVKVAVKVVLCVMRILQYTTVNGDCVHSWEGTNHSTQNSFLKMSLFLLNSTTEIRMI